MYVLWLTTHANGCCSFFPQEVNSFSEIFSVMIMQKSWFPQSQSISFKRGESNVEDLTFEKCCSLWVSYDL